MKKMSLIIGLLSVAPALGVVWENNPKYTQEQRQQARETNERIRLRNIEIKTEKEKQLNILAQKYKDTVENVKKRNKENPTFQEALATAELEVIASYDPEVQKYLDEVNAVKEKYREVMG